MTNSKLIAKAYVGVVILAGLLITGVDATPSNYDVNVSGMTVIASDIAYSMGSCVAAAENTNIQWATVNFNVSPTDFSGQAQFQINDKPLLGSFTGSYNPADDTTTWQTDDWLYSNEPIIRAEGDVDPDGLYRGTGDFLGVLGGEIGQFIWDKVISYAPTPWSFIGGVVGRIIFSPGTLNENEFPYNLDWGLQYKEGSPTADILGYENILGQPVMQGGLDIPSGTATVTPEPATVCLLGLGSLALLRRRRA